MTRRKEGRVAGVVGSMIIRGGRGRFAKGCTGTLVTDWGICRALM